MLNKLLIWFEKRISPYPQLVERISTKNIFSFLWLSVRGTTYWLVCFCLLGVMLGAFEASLFWMMGQLGDQLAQSNPLVFWREKQVTLLGFLGIIILSMILKALQNVIRLQTLIPNLPMRLRWWFHHMMIKQDIRFFQDEFAGRISTKVMQTALAVREVIMIVAEVGIYLVVYFIATALILIGFDWYFLLPFGLWGIIMSLWWVILIPKIAQVTRLQADARALMTGRVTDTYANIETVKLYAQHQAEFAYAKEAMDDFLIKVKEQMRLVTWLNVGMNCLNMSLIASTAFLGLWLWSYRWIGVGGVTASIAMAIRLNTMSNWVMWELASLFENIGIVKDGMNTFAHHPEVQDKEDAKKLVVKRGEVVFDDIDFAYAPSNPVFQRFSLIVKAGEKIGLVGHSGSGKSTLINLLLRFYDVDNGVISIDGQNIKEVTQYSLRQNIGMVTQDTSLLHRSVRENITYGMPWATEEEMIQAAKQAQAHDFIMNLSDKYGNRGYDVVVGERGLKLSGGQRQRISIARVILKKAPILVLDEATSALDSDVEAAIQDTLYGVMENKTVIAIAHRLSTIAAMDRLVVIDQGRIIEMGTHQELLDKNGVYAKLWARQRGGFLGVD